MHCWIKVYISRCKLHGSRVSKIIYKKRLELNIEFLGGSAIFDCHVNVDEAINDTVKFEWRKGDKVIHLSFCNEVIWIDWLLHFILDF